ncbi:MAG TPA: hypothetical protein H9973_03325 [Candidatus Alistipes cottocaccae]|nr:hypothetical protein [Candidatus Alistipes cottocaccae]
MKNSLKRFFTLGFDRAFSGRGRKQFAWLVGILLLFFGVIYLVSWFFTFPEPSDAATPDSPQGAGGSDVPMGRLLQLICLFIDPGSVANVTPELRWFSLGVAILGLVLVTGLLISVVSNMLERRVERYREGEIAYPLENHVVVIGFDEMVPMLVRQICSEPRYGNCYILIQSVQPAAKVRNRIHTVLDARQERRILVLHAQRNSTEELEKLCTTHAREIFLIGEANEYDHDSLNIDSLQKIVAIHSKTRNCPHIPVSVLFEYQTTYAAFQISDLAEEWRKQIDFHPFNFYEEWAKKLLVKRCYEEGTTKVEYPTLDREPITRESDQTVHLVIIGMSRMGVALGVEAAQLLHFPNFCRDRRLKSRITIIDAAADEEMNFFRGRYRHYFDLAPSRYRDMAHPDEVRILPPNWDYGSRTDFLDVEFEFIKGRAETPAVQQLLAKWAGDPKQQLSIAICLNFPPQAMAMGLYLPDVIYARNIPVFVRQETSSALLDLLNNRLKKEPLNRYSHVFPFGMLANSFDLDRRNTRRAQLVNYIYDYKGTYGTSPSAAPSDHELQQKWNKLPVALQWSNFYCADSVDIKLRSLGFGVTPPVQLTEAQVELMAEVEHNRWNMEKLLLGYRKPTPEEEILCRDKAVRKEYKEKRFIHTDIRPYCELAEGTKDYDRCISECLPMVAEQ